MLEFVKCVWLMWFLGLTNCFLLELATTKHPGENQKYLSFETYVAEKNDLIDLVKRENYQTQHNMEQMLQVLTTQLNRKLAAFETKIDKTDALNDTFDRPYRALEENYTKLQSEFESLQIRFESLEIQHKSQKAEMTRLRNKTLGLEKNLANLEQLKSIDQLQNVHSVQQMVQSLQQKTALLANNQNARNQDFLALYNQTLSAEKNIKTLKTQTALAERNIKHLQTNAVEQYYNFTNIQNQTFNGVFSQIRNLKNDTNNQLQNFVANQNLTFENVYSKLGSLESKVAENSKKVALTACAMNSRTINNGPVKFDHVYTQTGITSTNSFETTGKFTCDSAGLYYISAYIRSNTNNNSYCIMKNNEIISKSATTSWSSSQLSYQYSTSPIVTIVEAKKNDTIYVKTPSSIFVYGTYSCITITKIK